MSESLAPRVVPAAIVAGLATALAGGLLWTGVVLATKYDIGILAWFIGVGTGTVMFRLSAGTVGPATRVAAGMLAAAGIMLGKYVIFVHAVKATLDASFVGGSAAVGYADPEMIRFFVSHFTSIVRPMYAVWVGLAVMAAFRTAGGRRPFGRLRFRTS